MTTYLGQMLSEKNAFDENLDTINIQSIRIPENQLLLSVSLNVVLLKSNAGKAYSVDLDRVWSWSAPFAQPVCPKT